MLLAIDIGNTHIVTGILDKNGEVLLTFRVASNDKLTEDEYFSYLRNISEFNKIDIKNIEGIIVASVVPNLITIFQFLGKKYFHIDPMIVGPDIKIPFTFAPNLNPTGFGADRIIDIVQSLNDYPDKNLVIFDFGSATTYEVLEKLVMLEGEFFQG